MIKEPINKCASLEVTLNTLQSQITSEYFSILRVGGGEYNLTADFHFDKDLSKSSSDLKAFSGYYDKKNSLTNLKRFIQLYENNIKSASMLFAINEVLSYFKMDVPFPIIPWVQARQIHSFSLIEAMHEIDKWLPVLSGKKILVVSPFEFSIQHQYGKKLFDFDYPRFESLQVITSPITFNSNLYSSEMPDNDLFETANALIKKIKTADFDMAILGCGAYSTPIVHELQKIRKSHIVLGGMTQMIFGIKGGRYNTPFFNQLMNENWISPLDADRPKIDEKFFCYQSDGLGAYFLGAK